MVLQRKIGHGSFGDVFLADSKTYGTVAVKLLPANKAQVAKMAAAFKKEINLMKCVATLSSSATALRLVVLHMLISVLC